MIVEKSIESYTRKLVKENKNLMYIFTDNTDRDSGKNVRTPKLYEYLKSKCMPLLTI